MTQNNKASGNKSEAEIWIEQRSASGSSMAGMLLNLVSGIDPALTQQYLDMVYDATKGALAAVDRLSATDIEQLRKAAERGATENG